MKLDRVLVPIDFSAQSEAGLAAADDLATLAGGAELILLHVHQVAQLAIMDFTYVEPPEKIAAVVTAAENHLREMAKALKTPEARRRVVVEIGRPIAVIVDWSARVDLVVMPTHGRTGAAHFFLGSVAERVMQAARCSVLIVKSGG